ncbi:Metallo-dependent phosphatase, partial [Schizopora paradoxa]
MLAPQRGRRRRAFIAALKRLSVVNWVRIVWLVAVLWYELGAFFWSAAGCQWPNFDHLKLGNSKVRGLGSNSPAHVLLVADPQILDHRSYPGRSGWLMSLSQFIVDLNLRKSWLVASRFEPDVVIFLGDMMDNGRLTSSDEEYDAYVARFKSTFKLRDPETKVYYIPGNHDVGLRSSDQFHPRRRQRYLANFGPFNERISIANHTLALLDAPGLVEEDYKRASFGTDFENWKGSSDGAVEFIKEFRRGQSQGSKDPVILFTHIPLHRPDTASCGPLRERGTIRRGVGFGYQLTLGKLTAEFLLRNTRPSLVFSADDHDYCDYTHKVLLDEDNEAFTVREVTVKSFSMAMGIKKPGFQLLSLLPHESGTVFPQGVNTFADAPCLLPDQLTIYIERYLPLFVFTLIAL